MDIHEKKVSQYGYIGQQTDTGLITQKKGQYVTGYSVGILYLDENSYPVIPGNVANCYTYNFPVQYKLVPGCTGQALLSGDRTLLDGIIQTAKQFQSEGAKAISAACGFFGQFQSEVAEALDIPVYLSSLVQIPWIEIGLKSKQKIGVLTAYEAGLTSNLFQSCGVNNTDRLVIGDLSREEEFSAILEGRGSFDNDKIRMEVVQKAIELVELEPDIAAILLECSDLPPYAYDIQKAVQLPVYDYISLIRWVHFANSQRPYVGFI